MVLCGTLIAGPACGADKPLAPEVGATTGSMEKTTGPMSVSGTFGATDSSSPGPGSTDSDSSSTTGFVPHPDWGRFEVRFDNYTLPAQETTYACVGATMSGDQLRHVVAFEPLVDNAAVVHHMMLHTVGPDTDPLAVCYGNPDGLWTQWGWGAGGGTLELPPEAGFLFGESGPQRFVLVIHYNNPLATQGIVDSSGVALHYTLDLRPQNAGVLAIGHINGINIPPGEQAWEVVSRCSAATTQVFLAEPVNIFASWLHAHRLGVRLWSDQYRDGLLIDRLGTADPYYFESQKLEALDAELRPGDDVWTHCVYDSTGRTEPTVGGESSADEMCLNYMFYYPRQFFGLCGE